jgi:hypothetical protein
MNTYIEVMKKGTTTMTTTQSRRGYLGNIINILGAAISASAAVDGRRTPQARDLRTLGIDPASFPDVRRV